VSGSSIEIVLALPYDTYREMISDAQLDLETLAREMQGDIKTGKSAFSEPGILADSLTCVEDYLLHLVREYGRQRRQFQGSPLELPLSKLPLLSEFIKSSAIGWPSSVREPRRLVSIPKPWKPCKSTRSTPAVSIQKLLIHLWGKSSIMYYGL
jgi:hypothetical protein